MKYQKKVGQFMLEEEKYFTISDHLKNFYSLKSKKLGFIAENVLEYGLWKAELKTKLKEILGMNSMMLCELKPQIVESKKFEDYRRDKAIIQTEPGVWMPLYILIPDGIKLNEKRDCVIAPHGHGGGGKDSIVGKIDTPDIKESIDKYNYDYGLKFVRQGYVVFCSDARGAGERREDKHQGTDIKAIMSTSCNDINNVAISIGQTLVGMMTWDLMRLIDYIETLSYCDSSKIACCGFSGGGLQALWLSAIDERITCSVVSGYFYGFKDSILNTHLCGCNFVPRLWEYIELGDLAALIAPNPLLIESGTKDKLNGARGIVNAIQQVDITRKAYNIFNKKDNIYHHIFDGPHMWNGEKTYDFVNKWRKGFDI
ncbi:alpha/beta hydrolase family protein [Clostridium estertheticum]|uniref:alpha/beta hydrolase family protein n=2 Tax=Clostridium estertheticum TaxID=238834 RepID=UPI000A06CA2A|nr:alpha/beta hydrolase family protein [Clostridium estertheticum]MBZ9614449.1 alpha/beta hydrolase family protein [Clostridium estertheticum subsp. laramiense]